VSMTVPSQQPDPPPGTSPRVPPPATDKVLSEKAIAWGAAALLLIAAAISFLLYRFLGTTESAPKLEAIRVASTIALGLGGLVALYFAARRQRSTELTLKENARFAAENAADRAKDLTQREKAAEDIKADATERRITDLYTKAADQLGSEKAAVRLAGLYALERLANDTPAQRQTIVDVICAYLRMPYTPVTMPDENDSQESYELFEKSKQEGEVRHTAQDILFRRLSANPDNSQWSNMNLNLVGARLDALHLYGADLGSLDLSRAQITGPFSMRSTTFTGDLKLDGAVFGELATFRLVVIRRATGRFLNCHFFDGFTFDRTTFAGSTEFRNLDVRSYGMFKDCMFPRLLAFFGGVPPTVQGNLSSVTAVEAYSEWRT
jgi:hypothetical protein